MIPHMALEPMRECPECHFNVMVLRYDIGNAEWVWICEDCGIWIPQSVDAAQERDEMLKAGQLKLFEEQQ